MSHKFYRVRNDDGKYFAFSSIMERPIWLNRPNDAAHWASPAVPFELTARFGGVVEEVAIFGGPDGKTINRYGD